MIASPTAKDPNRARSLRADEGFPVLDLGNFFAGDMSALPDLGAQLRSAAETLGFYAVINHGVPPALINRAFDAAARFHALPLALKQAVAANEHNVGYMAYGASVSRASKVHKATKPNLNEAYFVKRDVAADHPDVLANKRFRGMNLWPDDLPGFREDVLAYCAAAEALALKLLPIYEAALELPPGYFDQPFQDPQFTLRLSHYPPVPAAEIEENQFALAPHTDSGFMTLLPQNDLPGLAIRHPDGDWFDQPVIPGSFMVNTGDILHRWSNHRFLSTPHRVINRTGTRRYAIPFFFDPHCDFKMACLPSCAGPDNPPRYEPTSYTEYMLWFSNKNYPQVTPKPGETVAKVD